MVKISRKAGLLLTLCGLFVTSSSVFGGSPSGAKIRALGQLADEYAETGKSNELQLAIKKLSVLREEWEAAGSLEPEPKEIQEQVAVWRKAIDDALQINVDSPQLASMVMQDAGLKEYNGSSLNKGEIVITFDDGPHPKLTPLVHKVVSGLKVPAAFFELGENIKAHPQVTRDLASEGYIIADHSWDHPKLTSLSSVDVAKQINDTQKEVQTVLGGADNYNLYFQSFFSHLFKLPETIYAPEFFRSPYGARSARTLGIISNTVVGASDIIEGGKKIIEPEKLYHIMWNIDSLDWQDKDPASIEKRVFNQLATNGHKGVILFHDIHPQTLVAIQSILPRLAKEGYKFVSLYEMVANAERAEEDFLGKP